MTGRAGCPGTSRPNLLGWKNIFDYSPKKSYFVKEINSVKLSVIIVNYNVKFFLEQCLCSVLRACRNIDAEILVVDNNSGDGSRDYFAGKYEKVQFLWKDVNGGFSKANNLALGMSTGEYILFLNPDTILPEDCLEKCISFYQGTKGAGAVGIRMIDGSGNFLMESKRAFPSPFTSLCKLTGLTAMFPRSRVFARYYLGHLDEHANQEVDVLAGAFMLISRAVLDKTGGFDERFFLYGEDVDLSYRIQQAGLKNFYFSGSTIIHFKGESMKRGSLNYLRLFYGAMILFVKKHYGGGLAECYKLVIQSGIGVNAVLAGIGHYINNVVKGRKQTPESSRCYIAGSQHDFDHISSVLGRVENGMEVLGRIDPEKLKGGCSANVQQVLDMISRQKGDEVIFCANGFSAKTMIAIIQQLPGGVRSRFHFSGSGSIVGSKHRNHSGDYIDIANTALKTIFIGGSDFPGSL